MKARTGVRAGVPTDGQACLDSDAAARAGLRGVGRRHGGNSPARAYCLQGEDAQEVSPSRVADARGEMLVPEPVGRLQVLVRERVVGPHERERRLVVEVAALPPDVLVLAGEQTHRLPPAVAPLLPP